MNRSLKQPFFEKQNQQKYVNKKTDILTSLNNIKLPLQHSLSYKENQQFQSVPNANLVDGLKDHCNSARNMVSSISHFSPRLSDTEEYCQLYGKQLQSLLRKNPRKKRFLMNHKIDGTLRARMLDWMVQVMGSYNFTHKTYFAGIELMDNFFESTQQVLNPSQLHIIGVVSMFIATKMQEVFPLKTKTVYQKISHKKIPISDLVEMQKKICQALKFDLTTATFFDLACTKITMSLVSSKVYSSNKIKQIEAVCSCLSKFISYNYEFICEFDKQTIANTLSKYILEIYKVPINNKNCEVSPLQIECREYMIDSIASFKRKFKGLNNLAKFTDKKILEIIEKGLF